MRKYLQAFADQYYTDPRVAQALLDIFADEVGFDHFDLIVEPSAGNGSFSDRIPHDQVMAIDIHPKKDYMIQGDFLKWNPPSHVDRQDVLCIGNPPFGDHATLAKQFINKCAQFSDHIAFILPQSFLLKSYLKSLPPTYHVVFSVPLKQNPFLVNGKPYLNKLKTIFIYIQNLYTPRPKPQQVRPNNNWRFLRKNDASERQIADFRIIQNGGRTGNCVLQNDPNYILKKTSNIYSDFYIQVKPKFKKRLKDVQTQINAYPWTFNNLTTWKSLSKSKVATALNSILV